MAAQEIWSVLGNERRRLAIQALDTEGGMPLRELAARITARETETLVDRVDASDRKRVYISLYQNHVEKLADAGLVTTARQSGRIEPTADCAQVATLIRTADHTLTDPDDTPHLLRGRMEVRA